MKLTKYYKLKQQLFQFMYLGCVLCYGYQPAVVKNLFQLFNSQSALARSTTTDVLNTIVQPGTLHDTRRSFLGISSSGTFISFLFLVPTSSASTTTTTKVVEVAAVEQDIQLLKDCLTTLTTLVDNWERATVDCNYADIPRELLEQKNKDMLLEKASTWALFDKSSSVVLSCKRTNRLVRDYIGVTGKGPCVGADKRMLKRQLIDSRVNPNSLEEYYTAVETYSQAMSAAISLSYTAGTADFDSVNNFDKGQQELSISRADTSLDKARISILEAKRSLEVVVKLLSEGLE
jgi:hypothetical protein